ncbi:MAG TPA: cupredoxin domain-containing protein [Candidatus Angelobacter sp.]|jgi:cytochrome c oxidase subunit 2|nr:cupredoxin domain-containing protein [Candidatus Angelobacter sp.]
MTINIPRYCLVFLFCFLFVAAGCHKNQAPPNAIKVVMKKYSFEPSEIHVKAGQPVALDVSTTDVQHGIDIPDLGVKQSVQPGRPALVTFTAPEKKGEYKIQCGVICGPHHDDMAAKLIVE